VCLQGGLIFRTFVPALSGFGIEQRPFRAQKTPPHGERIQYRCPKAAPVALPFAFFAFFA
jgi:hypothetical protein